jgi:hypothetical protein
LFVFLKQIILAVEEWDSGVHEDLTGSGDHQSMQHFSQVRKEAHILLTASQQAHPQAWAKFSARVHSPPSIPSRAPREAWPVRGLVRKRGRIESEEEGRKRAKWAKWEGPRREEEEESSEEGDGVTDRGGCDIPESEYEAVTDSDGYDAIPESEYDGFTDSEEHNVSESGFEGDDDELGYEGGRGREGGGQFESGGLMMMMLDDDEDEKDEVVYL